jgi:putative ABC transport system permease protein
VFRLAFRNLFQSPIRLVISVGGVALALLLVFSLDAILAGSERQLTAYIDDTGADLFISQKGVRNMHMASSSIPRITLDEVQNVDGVEEATPILYLTNVIDVGEQQFLAYIIGMEKETPFGGPWELTEGRSKPNQGEIIIDHTVAQKSNLSLGNNVDVLGRSFEIIGLSKGTTSIINSVAFINLEDFYQQRGTDQVISYILATVAKGQSPEVVAGRIESQIPEITASPRDVFSTGEASIIEDMGADIISLMNLIGFLIGLAVTGLTTYTATLARRSEYGMLKALGAKNIHLYTTVVWQALISVAVGFIIAIGLTLLLKGVIPFITPEMGVILTGDSMVKIAFAAGGIALVSAILPIRQISKLDPAMVFRR